MLPAGLYPVRGLLYFLYHPTLFRSCLSLVLKLLLISAGAFAVLSVTTYHLQLFAVSQLFGKGLLGHSAVLAALLAEAVIPVYLFSERFIRSVRNNLFDTVLRQQGVSHLSALTAKERTTLQTTNAKEQQREQEQSQKWGLTWKVCRYFAGILRPQNQLGSSTYEWLAQCQSLACFQLDPSYLPT